MCKKNVVLRLIPLYGSLLRVTATHSAMHISLAPIKPRFIKERIWIDHYKYISLRGRDAVESFTGHSSHWVSFPISYQKDAAKACFI